MEHVSTDIKELHRKLDIVNLKGSKVAMHLYTFDMYLDDIQPSSLRIEDFHNQSEEKQREYMVQYKNDVQNFHDKIYSNRIHTKTLFKNVSEIMERRKYFKKEFYDE